ncbi:MAG: PilZ domain-containing protein [Myxococcota bacterium]
MKGNERRKFPRVRTDSVISIARLDPPPVSLAHAIDLSKAGIRFQCVGVELQLGDAVRVTLTVADQTISVEGQLVRVVDLDAFTQEVALAFGSLDATAEGVLRSALPEGEEEV